ncbi:MAG TPA: methylenetetrahydrofolate reductase [Thermohalobaculum sp.]|nr:methylenetetrahydrofolate reductase [Thermohalobaculum sp.]
MAKILDFLGRKRTVALPSSDAVLASMLDGFSIEVMPRTARKIEDFRAILPRGTRVYVAHIEGTPIEDTVATARRLADEGFPVMPHFPARGIEGPAQLEDWVRRYRDEAGVDQALLLGGGYTQPVGAFDSSMAMIETGIFDRHGFRRLHVAGHPEGNADIDPDGGDRNVMEALRWKQAFAERTGAETAIVTQFAFEAEPVIAWADRLEAEGIGLPIHIGVAGPAKLQSMIRFAMACGVGPSLRVLQRRAADVTKLLMPFTPEEFLTDLAHHRTAHPDFNIRKVHFFPLGGIDKTAEFAQTFGHVRPAALTA